MNNNFKIDFCYLKVCLTKQQDTNKNNKSLHNNVFNKAFYSQGVQYRQYDLL